ncbi:hypothetical protein JHW43_003165 [Diplocarpon mali]|nr:hypothetical protein JHW43_003165 [Diplocarpon mali]
MIELPKQPRLEDRELNSPTFLSYPVQTYTPHLEKPCLGSISLGHSLIRYSPPGSHGTGTTTWASLAGLQMILKPQVLQAPSSNEAYLCKRRLLTLLARKAEVGLDDRAQPPISPKQACISGFETANLRLKEFQRQETFQNNVTLPSCLLLKPSTDRAGSRNGLLARYPFAQRDLCYVWHKGIQLPTKERPKPVALVDVKEAALPL